MALASDAATNVCASSTAICWTVRASSMPLPAVAANAGIATVATSPPTMVSTTRLRSGLTTRLLIDEPEEEDGALERTVVGFDFAGGTAPVRRTGVCRVRARRVGSVAACSGTIACESISSAKLFLRRLCAGALARQHSMSGHDMRASPHVDDEPVRQSTWGPVGGLLAWWTSRGYPKVTFMSRSTPGNLRTVRRRTPRPRFSACSAACGAGAARADSGVPQRAAARHPFPASGRQRVSSTRKMCDAISTGSSSPSSLPCICTST